MKISETLIDRDWRPAQAAIAGTLATAAYSVAMEGDKRLTGNQFDDVRFIEGILGGTRKDRRIKVLAWLLHFLNGIVLAEIYAAVVRRWLPGPDWLKGTIFGELFILGAWSLTPLADTYHPLIKNGELPRLANRTSFVQNLLRHLAFGLVLGLFYHSTASTGISRRSSTQK